MSTSQLIIICLTAIAIAAIAAAAWVFTHMHDDGEEELEPPARVGHRVTVHTKQPDDQTIFGVLVGDYADRIVLEDAEYVTASGATPISGQQHIATADIAWLDCHQLVAPFPEDFGVPHDRD
jgi:hypothetical protein